MCPKYEPMKIETSFISPKAYTQLVVIEINFGLYADASQLPAIVLWNHQVQ